MKIVNPFRELKPIKDQSFVEMMQGAFWAMIVINLAQYAMLALYGAIVADSMSQCNGLSFAEAYLNASKSVND